MVHMRHDERQSQCVIDFAQHVEQRYRIGTAGYGNQRLSRFCEETSFANVREHALRQRCSGHVS